MHVLKSALLVALGLLLAMPVEAGVRDSVVKIEVTSRRPDYFRPWAKRSPSKSSGSGVMISGNRILTNAHVVSYASQVQIQANGSSDKLSAEVVAIGPSIDLAILKLEDGSLADSIPPVEFSEALPKLRQKVTAYGYPLGGQEMSITEGVVSRIEFATYYYESRGLRIQVDAALNSGNSGGPVLSDDKLIGVVFSKIREADNIGYVIPVEEIERFLADVEDGAYDGKPTLFDNIHTTENTALRKRLGLTSEITGGVVEVPYEESDDGLKRWDVITAIGPHNIDNQGFVRLSDELRLHFPYFVPQLVKEGRVPLTVFRNGESVEVNLPVKNRRDMLLPPLEQDYPEYFIWGPVPFTKATAEIAVQGGPRLWGAYYAMDSPLLGRLRDEKSFEGEEIVVIPNRLFPHRISRGYDSSTFAVVKAINDQPVKNMRSLVELLRDADGDFVEIDLAGNYGTLVFNREKAQEATEEILVDEGIRHYGSTELRKVWEAEPEKEEAKE